MGRQDQLKLRPHPNLRPHLRLHLKLHLYPQGEIQSHLLSRIHLRQQGRIHQPMIPTAKSRRNPKLSFLKRRNRLISTIR